MQFKFCPKCGGGLEYKSDLLLTCKNCGFDFYQNPKICNAVILENKNGEVLLVKRFAEPKKGYWDLPGGFVDIDESLEDSTRREIKEELGIELSEIKYFGSYFSKYTYQGIDFDTLSAIFTAKFDGETFLSDGEISEAKFFKQEDINYKQIAFDAMEQALRDYFSRSLQS